MGEFRLCLMTMLMLASIMLACDGGGDHATIVRGLILRESSDIRPGTYLIPGEENDDAVITILGRDLEIDFQGAVLQGTSNNPEDSTAYRGTAICIDQATNVVIRNLTIKGYQTAISCKSCLNLELEGVDIANNRTPMVHTTSP